MGQPVDMCAEELSALIVGIDVWWEGHLRIDVHYRLGVDRFTRLSTDTARRRLDDIHMAQLPSLGACAGAVVGRASFLGREFGMYGRQHFLLTEELPVVLFVLGVETGRMIRIPRVGTSRRAQDRLVQPPHSTRLIVVSPRIVPLG